MNPLNGYQTYIVGGLSIVIGGAVFIVNTLYPDIKFPIDNGTASILIMTGLGWLGMRNAVSKIEK